MDFFSIACYVLVSSVLGLNGKSDFYVISCIHLFAGPGRSEIAPLTATGRRTFARPSHPRCVGIFIFRPCFSRNGLRDDASVGPHEVLSTVGTSLSR